MPCLRFWSDGAVGGLPRSFHQFVTEVRAMKDYAGGCHLDEPGPGALLKADARRYMWGSGCTTSLPRRSWLLSGLMDDFTSPFSPERGRCFRFVDIRNGHTVACDADVLASGWVELDGQWYQVDSCNRHSGELRSRGKL